MREESITLYCTPLLRSDFSCTTVDSVVACSHGDLRFWLGTNVLLLPPAYVVWREGTVFTGVCLLTFRGGVPHIGLDGRGVPHPRSGWGGTPFQVWTGGYPIPGLAGGYPISGLGGTPQTWDGVLPLDMGWGTPGHGTGYPPRPEMGYPPPDRSA